MGMRYCPMCHTRYHNNERIENGKKKDSPMCGNCVQGGVIDGSNQHWRIVRSLHNLLNDGLSDSDLKMVAHSYTFVWLVISCLPHLPAAQMTNVLKNVLEEVDKRGGSD